MGIKITFISIVSFLCVINYAYAESDIFELIDANNLKGLDSEFVKNVSDKKLKDELSPVMYCVVNEKIEAFNELLKLGADYNYINAKNETVHSLILKKENWKNSNVKKQMLISLDACIKKKDTEDASRMLGKIDVKRRDEKGMTVLMHTVSHGNYDVVKMLLEKGADPNIKDDNGKSVLDYVCLKNGDDETKAKIVSLIKIYQ